MPVILMPVIQMAVESASRPAWAVLIAMVGQYWTINYWRHWHSNWRQLAGTGIYIGTG